MPNTASQDLSVLYGGQEVHAALWHTAAHCDSLRYTAARCGMTVACCGTLRLAAAHCGMTAA